MFLECQHRCADRDHARREPIHSDHDKVGRPPPELHHCYCPYQTKAFLPSRPSYDSTVKRAGGASGGGALNLDDMLSDLTSNPIASLAPGNGHNSGPSSASSSSSSASTAAILSKRRRGLVTPQSARSRRSSAGGGSTASRGSAGRRPPVPSAWTVRDYEDDAGAGGDGDFGDHGDGDFGDGGVEHFDGEEGADVAGGGDGDATMQDVGAENQSGAAAAVVESSSAASESEKKLTAAAAVVPLEAPGDKAAAPAAPAAKPRSRFARLKETNDIAVTAAAEAALRPKAEAVEKAPVSATGAAVATAKGGDGKATGVGSTYMPSLEFQGPQYALSEAPSTSAGTVANASSWLQKVRGECWLGRRVVLFFLRTSWWFSFFLFVRAFCDGRARMQTGVVSFGAWFSRGKGVRGRTFFFFLGC